MYSEGFTFNGRHSGEFGIISVRNDSSMMIEKPIIGDAELIEIKHPYDHRPYLYRTSRSPLEFTLQLALVNYAGEAVEWSSSTEQDIYAWLLHDSYKELCFDNEPDLVYYVLAIGDIKLYTNNDKGYLQVRFKSNSPYAWNRAISVTMVGDTMISPIRTINLNDGMAFKKVYINVVLTRIEGATSADPIRIYKVGEESPERIIGLDPTKIVGINKIYINGRNKTITDGFNSLFRYRTDSPTTDFPYLTRGANNVSVPRGWNAVITYQIPVFR